MDEECIELDEFEIFRSRAYSKKKVSASRSDPVAQGSRTYPGGGAAGSGRNRTSRANRSSIRHTASAPVPQHNEPSPIAECEDSRPEDVVDDFDPSFREHEDLINFARSNVERLSSNPEFSSSRKMAPCRLGRSYSCRPRATRPVVNFDVKPRTRINSLADCTVEILRHGSLSSQSQLRHTGSSDFKIYRVRSFTTTSKGIINRGDSFKIRSPLCRRPLLQESSDDMGSSIASITSPSKLEQSIVEDDDDDGDDKEEDGSQGQPACLLSIDDRPGQVTSPMYRVLIWGSHGVGKSALKQQFMTSEYVGDMDESSQPDDNRETRVCVEIDGEESVIDFLDELTCRGGWLFICNGSEDDILIWPASEPTTPTEIDAHLIVFSVTDKSSFRYAEGRLREVRNGINGDSEVVIVVANKQDLVRNRVVNQDDGIAIANKYSCKYTEVSAILNHQVDELLVGVTRQIRMRPERSRSMTSVMCGSSQGGVPYSCLPQGLADFIRRLFGQKEDLSKSCENLLVP